MNKGPGIEIFLASGVAGTGAFTRNAIARKSRILELSGPRLRWDDIEEYYPDDGLYTQIGPDLYMGPSGDDDDYFNHSCDPNCMVQKINNKYWYVARRDIPAGAELTWDYSTYIWKEDWEMPCHCGSPLCRGKVAMFETLPKKLQQTYLREGAVPDYIAEHYR